MNDDFSLLNIILKRNPIFELGEFYIDKSSLKEDSIIVDPVDIGKGIKVRVYVYGSERTGIPHLHLVSDDFGKNGDCCIKLLKSAICPHKNHKSILVSSQCKKFDEYMRKPYRKDKSINNWQAAIKYWSDNVSNLGSPSQPNYSDAYKHIEPIGG